jgi:carbon-monoxide dehydrogenase small subunit
MKLNFILNGEAVTANVPPDLRLIDLLRDYFSLIGAKSGCLCGRCGACSVMFNGAVTKACLIPAFRAHNSKILTIEGFEKSPEYRDISKGFEQGGLELCGYCNAGKIFATEALLTKNLRPSQQEILYGFRGIKCRCSETASLISGVLASADLRQRRLYGRST